MAQFKQGDIIHDARLGTVAVLEAHDATENSVEQYTVLTDGGEVVRTVLQVQGAHPAGASDDPQSATEYAEATEPTPADVPAVPDPNEQA